MSTTLSAAMEQRKIGIGQLAMAASVNVNEIKRILDADKAGREWTIESDQAGRLAAALGYPRVYDVFRDENLVAPAHNGHRGEKICQQCYNTIPLRYGATCPHCNNLE